MDKGARDRVSRRCFQTTPDTFVGKDRVVVNLVGPITCLWRKTGLSQLEKAIDRWKTFEVAGGGL